MVTLVFKATIVTTLTGKIQFRDGQTISETAVIRFLYDVCNQKNVKVTAIYSHKSFSVTVVMILADQTKRAVFQAMIKIGQCISQCFGGKTVFQRRQHFWCQKSFVDVQQFCWRPNIFWSQRIWHISYKFFMSKMFLTSTAIVWLCLFCSDHNIVFKQHEIIFCFHLLSVSNVTVQSMASCSQEGIRFPRFSSNFSKCM